MNGLTLGFFIRSDFDGKNTTVRTLKARKKVRVNFLSSSRSVFQRVTVYNKKDNLVFFLVLSEIKCIFAVETNNY
jgi:ABC-type lipopolysaccharide export system ATPase subunit